MVAVPFGLLASDEGERALLCSPAWPALGDIGVGHLAPLIMESDISLTYLHYPDVTENGPPFPLLM